MLPDDTTIQTYIIVEQVADTHRVIAYVKQCTLRDVFETKLADSALSVFELSPEDPPYSLYGGWRLKLVTEFREVSKCVNLQLDLCNEVRRMPMHQAYAVAEDFERAVRKAASEAREVDPLPLPIA